MSFMHNNLRTIVGAALGVQLYILMEIYFKANGVIIWSIQILILSIFYKNIKKHTSAHIDTTGAILIYIFIGWLFTGALRACLYAESYWVWKYVMQSILLSLFYIVIILGSNILFVRGFYRLYWKYFLPLVLITIIFLKSPIYLSYLPYSTLLLFLGAIPKNKRGLLLGIVVFFFITNEQRNDMAKIIVALALGLSTLCLYNKITQHIFRFAHIVLLVAPLVLLFLGVSGKFNVFKMDDYIKGDYEQKVKDQDGEVVEESFKTDTRTALFQNVFYTMDKYNAWIIGRSPAYGDEGLIGGFSEINKKITGISARYGNEVGILDILLWYGIIGVLLYFFIYIRASYLAIYKSKNRYAVAIGIYVAFLWCWAFVWEKPMFETFFMVDLILLGICLSKTFRNMTDYQIEKWIRRVFVEPKRKQKKQKDENTLAI